MKHLLIPALIALFIHCTPVVSQTLYFPPLAGNTWDTLSPVSLGWKQDRLDTLFSFLEAQHSTAFIVLKDGRMVIEKYFGTFTADSAWYWASAGKSLTAFLIGIAVENSYLSMDDTTAHILGSGWTSATAAQEGKITAWHHLTMTTGLDDGVPDPDCTMPSCLLYLADAGTRWAYHNAPYTLLDQVIQQSTGSGINAFMVQHLQPLTGITGLYLPLGYNNVFFSKPRSMARFGLLMLNGGVWDTSVVLKDTTWFHRMVNSSQPMNPAYGFLWWLNGKSSFMVPGFQWQIPGWLCPHAPADMYSALGKNGQILNVVPSQKLVMVRMGDAPGTGEVSITFNDTIWQLFNAAMPAGIEWNPSLTATAFRLDPNPATARVTITPGKVKDCTYTVRLYDMGGRLLLVEEASGDHTLSTQHLPQGFYLLQIVTSEGLQWNGKMIKR